MSVRNHSDHDKNLYLYLHRKDDWRDIRRSDGLTYHALVALITQVVFIPLTVTALIGVAKVKK